VIKGIAAKHEFEIVMKNNVKKGDKNSFFT